MNLEWFSAYFRGLIIAVVFGVPAGAIGALTIQRTLEKGFVYGFVTGLGSSAADVLYAGLSVFGLTAISDWILKYSSSIRITGCILILIYGIVILLGRNKVQQTVDGNRGGTLLKCFSSAFLIAILNPATILSFTIAFSTFDVLKYTKMSSGLFLLTGILVGTILWWFALSVVVNRFRNRITVRIHRVLNVCLGTLMIFLSIGIAADLLISAM